MGRASNISKSFHHNVYIDFREIVCSTYSSIPHNSILELFPTDLLVRKHFSSRRLVLLYRKTVQIASGILFIIRKPHNVIDSPDGMMKVSPGRSLTS